ncbi:phosphatidate cytidylyltransferase [Agriterribacter sp.]|uniref:phosphatidate cytidylyltransferase n=1 Tax=Agriterribacter sp. TaxID=2821509 RepID=UPI002C692DBC|nr:phosphatidate cytidylyltransferase [Agriterribacter sp.]HRP57411.1 phosphatidate cytidylyltransferase [Agriterribacter sp.]
MNWQVFKTRALTALVFVAVMLAGLLWNEWSFFILFSVIHWGCWIEYQRLLRKIDPSYASVSFFHEYGVVLAGWSLMLYCAGDEYRMGGISLHAIGLITGLIFSLALPITEILFSRQFNLKHISYSAMGIVYISLSWALMISMRSVDGLWISAKDDQFEIGRIVPLVVIFSIWINDTMAYITGSLIGKTPFSKVSPKKTIEGTIGGAVWCVAAMGLLAYYVRIPVVHVCVIAGIAAILGTAGDLLESKLKRMADVKDSGHLMPGHGGFLDRFDSLLLATPVVWLYVMVAVK